MSNTISSSLPGYVQSPLSPNQNRAELAETSKAQNNIITSLANGQDLASAHSGLDQNRVAKLLGLLE